MAATTIAETDVNTLTLAVSKADLYGGNDPKTGPEFSPLRAPYVAYFGKWRARNESMLQVFEPPLVVVSLFRRYAPKMKCRMQRKHSGD